MQLIELYCHINLCWVYLFNEILCTTIVPFHMHIHVSSSYRWNVGVGLVSFCVCLIVIWLVFNVHLDSKIDCLERLIFKMTFKNQDGR